jgi:hypothetical protein
MENQARRSGSVFLAGLACLNFQLELGPLEGTELGFTALPVPEAQFGMEATPDTHKAYFSSSRIYQLQ